ncbi:MAG: hypothetical protein AB7O88_02910, partial [Reyranellaceae bacterium]
MIRRKAFAIVMMAAAVALCGPAMAQTPQDAAEWLKGLGIKLNSKEATPELVEKATRVDFGSLARDKTLVAADLDKLKAFPRLADVSLGNRAGSDQAVTALVKAVPHLHRVSVHNSAITDAALAEIAKLGDLTSLTLFRTKITAAGMAHVARIKTLKNLDVSSSSIGDDGLEAIKGLPALRSLSFNSMKGVTRKGMAAI